jgi:hypothetical protein
VAIWAGIFSAAATIVDARNFALTSVGGGVGWLTLIATALAWIAAGAIYNAGRRATRTKTYTQTPTVVQNQPPAK